MSREGRRPSKGIRTGQNVTSRSRLPREMWLLIIFGLILLIIAGRLVYLQVIKGPELADAAQEQRTRNLNITSRRGTIYDRNGNVLATSIDASTIYANPREITDPLGTADSLAEVLGGTSNDYYPELIKDKSFVYIAEKIDPSLADEVVELGLKGIFELSDKKRVYPYDEVAGQIVGAVGRDGEGLTGLELYYDDILSGIDGELIVERGLRGTPIVDGVKKEIPAVDGTDIVLALDINVQSVAQQSLQKIVEDFDAISGTVIVLDTQTGGIVSTASTPYLDPSDLSNASQDALRLRAVSDSYEPGSTFKPVTMLIAMEQGTTRPDKVYEVPEGIAVGDHTVTDAFKRSAGSMTTTEILERSSNVGTVLIAREIGADAFADSISKFGFGRKTGIDFPGETSGIIMPRENYNNSTLGSMSFGQGISTSPLRLATVIGAIADEGRMHQPHFVVSIGGDPVNLPKPERIAKTANADAVAAMMKSVVENSAASRGAIEGYTIAAKTGTAQRVREDGKGYMKGSYVSSFIGFGPTENPRFLTYVLVEGVPQYGSQVSIVFKEVMAATFDVYDIAPTVVPEKDEDTQTQEQE